MSDIDHAFRSGVLAPDEVKLLRDIVASIRSETWFSPTVEGGDQFALYVLRMYRLGMVIPEKLEAVCRIAAKAHFASDAGLALPGEKLDGNQFLVVEDELLLAAQALAGLTATGAEVVGPVATVGEALELVGERRLDGALLDIALDGEMVFPVAAMLREKNVPFAFITGYDKPNVPPAFRDVTVFPKPADWSKVAAYLMEKRRSPAS